MFMFKKFIRSHRPAAAAALLLLTALIFYAGARMLPAIADETSWEDSIFGPLDGLEQSVYSQTIAAYQDSFLSVARKQQPILGYTSGSNSDIATNNFRTLPIDPDNYADDAAIEPVDHSSSQDIYKINTTRTGYERQLRSAAVGIRPVSANLELYNNTTQSYTFPSDVYMEITGDYGNNGNSRYLLYSYIAEDKTQQTKKLTLSMTKTSSTFNRTTYNSGRMFRGRPLDCVAADLNGDGYSELVVAYLTKSEEDISNNNNNPEYLYIYIELYDGKMLFDAKDGESVGYTSRLNLYETNVNDDDFRYMPCQVRIAKGDFNGDGVMEFPIAFSSAHYNNLALVKYDKDSGGLKTAIETINFHDLYDYPDQATTEGMDVAVGDFDGNDMDEIMVVYGKYSGKVKYNPSKGKNENHIAFACYKADIDNGSFTAYFNEEDDSVNLWCDEYLTAQISAEAADFDGDGKDELAYAHPGWVDGGDNRSAYISVREWTNLDGIGTLLCNKSTYDMLGWSFAPSGVGTIQRGGHAMAIGNFKCMNDNDMKQIAIASCNNSKEIDYAVIEPYADLEWKSEFKTHGYKSVTDVHCDSCGDSVSYPADVSLTAVDYDHQTMLLGEPTVYTLDAKIQPIFELQMAAKHFDIVDGTSIDAFSKQPTMPMFGYYKTEANGNESDELSSTETTASETTVGVSVKASGSGETGNTKVGSVSGSAGYSYTNTQKESNTQNKKYSTTSSVSAAGVFDDFVAYQTNKVDIYRYPIIYPRGKGGSISDDIFGTSGDVEASEYEYLQIQVPQEVTEFDVNGLKAEWYDPVHQPYNLFTYPRKVSELNNYSTSTGYTTTHVGNVGGTDSVSIQVKLSEMQGETDTESTTNKNSVNAELGVGLGAANETTKKTPGSASVSFNYDKVNSESSTSSSNLTKTTGYTMLWPGRLAFNGIYTAAEMENALFSTGTCMMVENTGNFVMAQTVPSLASDTNSSIWWKNGSYGKKSDPSLNLPHRFDSDTYTYKEATSSDDTPRIMRGVTIYNGQESAGATLSTNNTSYRSLMADENYTVKVRVYNCSFVNTKGVNAELYWTNEWKDESELTEADKVGSTKSPYSLNGWTADGDSNITEFAIEWNASDKLDEVGDAKDGMLTGYLHVKLVPEEDEIHSDNNWGYVRMSLLDPDIWEGNTSASVSSAKLTASKSSSVNTQPPVTTEFVKGSAEIVEENGKKYIQAKVHLTSKVGLPDVKLLVISHQKNGRNIVVAGRALGGIHSGEDNEVTVKAPFVEEIAKNSAGVSVKVLSPWLKSERKTPEPTPSSGGGCNAGLAALAALFALALIPLADKRKK